MDFTMLNAKQRLVAENLQENILLLASAGTGKTNTLSCRIANILEKQLALPGEIVCLTFTNKACNEMQNRIQQMLGTEARKIIIKTFHGFCYSILQQAGKVAGDLPRDFTVFDETDAMELIRSFDWCDTSKEAQYQALINLMKEYRGEYNFFTEDAIADYNEVLQRLKRENHQRIMDAAKCRGGHNDDLLMKFESRCGEITASYDNALRENHGVDFADLLNMVFQLLQENDFASSWQKRFKFWCVDEVQDTSRLEYLILTKMFGKSRLLLCGDYFQTIYQWRGSDPQLLYSRYSQEYTPRLVIFYENYRSTQCLFQAGYGYLQKRFAADITRLYKEDAHSCSSLSGEKIVYKKVWGIKQEAYWIYLQLQRLQPENLAQVCILVRANYYGAKLSTMLSEIMTNRYRQWQEGALEAADFPLNFMLVDEFKFFRRQEIKDAVAALRLLLNPRDNTSLQRLCKRFVAGIGPAAMTRLLSDEYKDAGIRLTDFISLSGQKYAEPFEMLLRALERGQVVVFDVETTGLDTARDEIIQLAAIKINLQGEVQDRLMHYVQASCPVGDSEAVHHISDSKLAAEGMESGAALQKFLDFAKDCVIVGHNVVFDLSILSSQLQRLDLPQLDSPVFYDTLDIYRRFYPYLPNYKLEYLGNRFQVEHKSSHDAFDDICATGELLIHAVGEKILPLRDTRRTYMNAYVKNFAQVAAMLNSLREEMQTLALGNLVIKVIQAWGMDKYYQKDEKRLENLRNLVRQGRKLEREQFSAYAAVQEFLRLAALSNTELDLLLATHPKIPIITVHQAKGSEFNTVFLAGLQEGSFPTSISLRQNNLEEEARLFYVAITRAKERLYLSSDLRGNAIPCRFIHAIPEECITVEEK